MGMRTTAVEAQKKVDSSFIRGGLQHTAVRPVPEHEAIPFLQTSNMKHDFSRIRLRTTACSPCIQTKLTINKPGDKYEQEADRIADLIMRMPEPDLQRQIEPEDEEEEGLSKRLQMSPLKVQRSATPQATLMSVPPIVHEVLASPGRPFDGTTLAYMEPRFGHSFSQVRVHTDAKATKSARAVNAKAYTVGQHIIFGEKQYSPRTNIGKNLLAHELTHTIQQTPVSRPIANGLKAPQVQAHLTANTAPLHLQRRMVREEYSTAAYETGPVWDVTLTIIGAPDRNSEQLREFINACMDGIHNAVYSLGRGREVLSRHIRIRMRYRHRLDYVTIEHEASASARRSVLPRRPREAVPQEPRPAMQEAPPAEARPVPIQPKTVIVIGSPSPGQAYGFQFVSAALCHSNDKNTLWLVERSGYEMIYGTNPGFITDQAPAGGYGWITPSHNLVGWINSMPDSSIGRLVVYSHGVPNLVSLRYGWASVNMPNYGLNLQDIARISPSKFADNASIEFNSCNTGINTDEGNLAQAFANRTGHSVQAWTGRTSYAGINRGTCRVQGSRYTLSTDAISEFWSRRRAGASPQLRTFTPQASATP
ncbi:MAG: DUF4157 domain-containing protein [Anaerolineales bacterium]|nr:DUF4157 domain-containing protein [Anaerolineales bacterium]